jgi:predicted anti-sigma-YlaC factor YlaD
MRCPRARDLLVHAIDRPLAPEDHALLTAHLESCPECRRFAAGLRLGHAHHAVPFAAHDAPDLTERVLANVRPLPPPWVYEERQQSRQVPHFVAFAVGALGVVLAFLMLCLTLIVTLTGRDTPTRGDRRLFVPEAWHDVRLWFDSVPHNPLHAAVTLVGAALFLFLAASWFRMLAGRVGQDHR